MRYILRSICLMAGLLVAALPAQAADIKPYTGAGVGGFIIDAGVGSKTAFGGYGILGADLHENYGIELRLGTTGKTGSPVTVPSGQFQETTGGLIPILVPTPANISIDWFFSYLLKLQYPFGNGFRIYGVVGGTTMNSKFAFTSPVSGRTVLHATATTLSFGGGIDYDLGNQWLLGVDGTVYSNKANTNPGASYNGLDVWGLTATAKYMF